MSLVSNLFLLFVAASILIYYIVPRKSQWIVLLIFSYLYYIAGGPRYVVFILFSTLVTWLMALLIEKAEGKVQEYVKYEGFERFPDGFKIKKYIIDGKKIIENLKKSIF